LAGLLLLFYWPPCTLSWLRLTNPLLHGLPFMGHCYIPTTFCSRVTLKRKLYQNIHWRSLLTILTTFAIETKSYAQMN